MSHDLGRTDAPKNEASLRAWLALIRAPDTGPKTLLPLLAETPDPTTWFDLPPRAAPKRLQAYLRDPDWGGVDRDQLWLEGGDRHLIPIDSDLYPGLLARLPDPPVALFVHGRADLLGLPQLAVVGSRNPTAGGQQTAQDFARFLAAAGLVITSGMAMGIDAAAHRGALQGGTTVAVAGTGLARVYPASHRELAHEIAARGALVSEFSPDMPPKAGNFPRRNRVISGLSTGTLVVEAALKSGSLITARLALEQGREVFAIPGSIHNPLARGCHALDPRGRQAGRDGSGYRRRTRSHVRPDARPDGDASDSGSPRIGKCRSRSSAPAGGHGARPDCGRYAHFTHRIPARGRFVNAAVARARRSCIIPSRWTVHTHRKTARVNLWPRLQPHWLQSSTGR